MQIQKFLEYFKDQIQLESLSKNDYFASEGQYSKKIAWIKTGFIRSFQIDYKGNDVSLNFFQPGEFCGAYYAFYSQQPSVENLIAMTDCELYTIRYEELMKAYQGHLELNIFGRKSIEEVCIRKDFRIAKLLQLNAEGRYKWFLETYPEIYKIAQGKHIASFLGIQPETLSRIRKKLIS